MDVGGNFGKAGTDLCDFVTMQRRTLPRWRYRYHGAPVIDYTKIPRRGCECGLCRKVRGLKPLSEWKLTERRLTKPRRIQKRRAQIEHQRPCPIENISEI